MVTPTQRWNGTETSARCDSQLPRSEKASRINTWGSWAAHYLQNTKKNRRRSNILHADHVKALHALQQARVLGSGPGYFTVYYNTCCKAKMSVSFPGLETVRYGASQPTPGRPRTQALTARACWSPYCLSVRWNYDYIRGALTCAFSALLRLWQIHCSVTWAVVQNYTLEFDSIYIGNDNSDSVLGTSQVFNYKHYIWVTLANH